MGLGSAEIDSQIAIKFCSAGLFFNGLAHGRYPRRFCLTQQLIAVELDITKQRTKSTVFVEEHASHSIRRKNYLDSSRLKREHFGLHQRRFLGAVARSPPTISRVGRQ